MRRDHNGALYWKGDNTDWLDILRTIPIQADFQLPDLLVAQHTDRSEGEGAWCIQSYTMLYEEGIDQFYRWHKAAQVRAVNSCADESFPRSQE
ncbi:hypothetical protein JG687_00017922 [Phytophthora cactorum]|uniref:Uncharacterized protein n=2 Tax=Phytophthora cactorum TaxID=29920 RepID=A0A8T1TR75_9STRA|nr:hypothetical protein JG687_00017922 [Phytophthora cactorum]